MAALHLAQRALQGRVKGEEKGGEVACDLVMWRVLGADEGDVDACLEELVGLYEEGVGGGTAAAAAAGGGGG